MPRRLPGPVELGLIDRFREEVDFWMVVDPSAPSEWAFALDDEYPEVAFLAQAGPMKSEYLARDCGDGSGRSVREAIADERIAEWVAETDTESLAMLRSAIAPVLSKVRLPADLSPSDAVRLLGPTSFERSAFEHAVLHLHGTAGPVARDRLVHVLAASLGGDGWCEFHTRSYHADPIPNEDVVWWTGDFHDVVRREPLGTDSVRRVIGWYDLATAGGATAASPEQLALWSAMLRTKVVRRSFEPATHWAYRDREVRYRPAPPTHRCGTWLLHEYEIMRARTAFGVFDDLDGVFD